jgi:DNA-binding PadR family transcriptional regulator
MSGDNLHAAPHAARSDPPHHSLPSVTPQLLQRVRDDGTHGTGLMDDMAQLFDVQPSPGTVYPRLHDLESDGTHAS